LQRSIGIPRWNHLGLVTVVDRRQGEGLIVPLFALSADVAACAGKFAFGDEHDAAHDANSFRLFSLD
jgi:hypothetical protein